MHELSPHKPNEVREQSKTQYESLWNGYADARRALYPYEIPPWEDKKPYNIWEDMADYLDVRNATLVYDLGTNDGYFHSILRHKGFTGKFVGIDIEDNGLPAVELIARQRFPGADVRFIQGDAQNLSEIVPDSSAPRAVAGFLPYHAPKPGRILSELHRILEPTGIGEVASRDVTNQMDTWSVARLVAHSNGFAFPQELDKNGRFISGIPIERISVYSHFDISQTRDSLRGSKKFEILHEHVQDKDLLIPATETGFFDFSRAVESLLPYTVNITDQSRPENRDFDNMHNFINEHIRQFFLAAATRNQLEKGLPEPCYISHATQAFFVVKAIK